MQKLIAKAVVFLGLSVLTKAESDSATKIATENAGLRLEVTYQRVYETSREVTIRFTTAGLSEGQIKAVKAFQSGYEIQLRSPDGNLLQPFSIEGRAGRRRGVSLQKEGNVQRNSVNLSRFFPINKAGEYTCVLKKFVYDAGGADVEKLQMGDTKVSLGNPVILTSPEFRFRVASVDLTYKSPLADLAHQTSKGTGNSPAAKAIPTLHPSKADSPNKTEARESKLAEKTAPSLLPWLLVLVAAAALVCLRYSRKPVR